MLPLVAPLLLALTLSGPLDTLTRPSAGLRSTAPRLAFLRSTGFPQGRPGYVVDHIIPLACGGPDHPWNMQWQTTQAAKLKDRVERRGC
jgi:hypothetical protein